MLEGKSAGTGRWIKDKIGKMKGKEAKKRNLQNSVEIWFHFLFLRGSHSQHRKREGKDEKEGKREGWREKERKRGERERERPRCIP